MKRIAILLVLIVFRLDIDAQGLGGLLNKAKNAVAGNQAGLTNDDIVAGLKEALLQGTLKGSNLLSQTDGFFANAALKILLPPEAQRVEKILRSAGLGKQVDEAILSMNRAAEDACKNAAPIFTNAIQQMNVQDAVGILKGSDTAATSYLKTKTTNPLTEAFRPVIEASLQKTDATKHWNSLVTGYNKLPLVRQKLNPDLSAYVTERAMSGIFYQIALEEKEIRKNPLARTSDILKKVFGAK